MSERLVPFRSLRRHETEQALLSLVAIAGGITERLLYDQTFALLGMVASYVAAALLLGVWVRRSGLELVTREEERRRHTGERANAPVWVEAINVGASTGTTITAISLVGLFPAFSRYFLALAGASFLVGAAGGMYLAIEARRAVANKPPPEMTRAESTLRHILGYVVGLASGLAAGSALQDRTLATAAVFVAFLAAKLATDLVFPGPSDVTPVAGPRPKSWQLLVALPYGMIRWGLPWGCLASLLTITAAPDTSAQGLLVVFAAVAALSGLAATIATLTAHLMGLVTYESDRKPKSD